MFVDITFFQFKENNYATKVQIKNENNNIILYYSSFANHYSLKKTIFAPMKHTYYPQGTCSQVIEFEIVDGKIHNVQFYGGCDGNTQGVGRLVEGMDAEEVVQRLEGIRCGFKSTSCPDQLAKAIKAALVLEKMD